MRKAGVRGKRGSAAKRGSAEAGKLVNLADAEVKMGTS